MRTIFFILLQLFFVGDLFCTETIVFMRHGEKPSDGLGQLSCKGLNRSLKLPNILIDKFGVPDFLMAPDPTKQKSDKGVNYNYIRPLATIEPTAITVKKNVGLECGFDQTMCMAKILTSKKYEDKTVFVAWEHHLIKVIIEKIASIRGTKLIVPEWQNDDFDSIYILKVNDSSVVFSEDKQGLNNLSDKCSY